MLEFESEIIKINNFVRMNQNNDDTEHHIVKLFNLMIHILFYNLTSF